MKVYTFDSAELTATANSVKEALLIKLERDGLLKQPGDDIAKNYVVVLHRPSWFGKLFASMCSIGKDELRITVLKAD
jgi:hypothetical protein